MKKQNVQKNYKKNALSKFYILKTLFIWCNINGVKGENFIMEFSFESIMGFIRANFFYDLKSSIVSLCVIIGGFFFYKLLKDKGDKVAKSLRYLTCVVVCFAVVMLLY